MQDLLKKFEGASKGVTLMTDKSSFTPDEWKLLLESPMAAGIAISAAELSGLWGLLKESFASSTELAKRSARLSSLPNARRSRRCACG